MARAGLQESWKVTFQRSLRDGSSFSLPSWIRSAVNSQMCTILVERAFSKRVPVTGETGSFQEIRRTVHGVHVLVQHAPHVAALAAQDPLHAQAFGFGVDLGVEPLDHLVGGEQAEVAALGGIGAEGVIEADFVQQREIAEEGVIVRRAEVVGRGHDQQNLRALAVDGGFHADAGDLFELIHGEIEAVLEAVRLNAQVIAGAEAVGGGFQHPVDVDAHQVHQLARHHGDFGGVDAVRAEDRAAAALGALVEVVEPLLEDVLGEVAGAGQAAEAGGRPAVK